MFLLALDQGTTSSRAILFDDQAQQLALAQRELQQIYPAPGHVEHDPLDIWQTQLATAREVIAQANISPKDIAAIGITNQRETTILWDKATGQPLHNAIVWQDRRTADRCVAIKQNPKQRQMIREKTGLVPDAYFSASKLEWLLNHIPGARDRAAKGQLAFGTVDSWLLFNLTGGTRGPGGGLHATDVSNASRTMLLNLRTADWDIELFDFFNIPYDIFYDMVPIVMPSAFPFGTTHPDLFGHPIPITGIAGDQQAALFGQTCFSPGLAKNTYGTGCFLLMNTGNQAVLSKHQLLSTIAWQLPKVASNKKQKSKTEYPGEQVIKKLHPPSPATHPLSYALEGSVFVGGAVVQWLRDGLGIIQSAADIEPLARSVPDSGGIYLVPAFAGLGAPHWDQYARGTIIGLTRGTTKAHLARAALEAIAFQVADLLDVINTDSHLPLKELRVDGGAAKNDLLLQFQSDLLQLPVIRPKITETTALGAALLAGLGVGLYKSTADLAHLWKPDRQFDPQLPPDQIARRRARWSQALNRARDWELPTP